MQPLTKFSEDVWHLQKSGFHRALLHCALVLSFSVMDCLAASTLYVGLHFEVREHDAPVKYVFNGGTRVARITGSLSTNERIQRLRLRAGWNLVSLAVTAPDFLGQLGEFTSGPAPVIKALHRWRPATRNYETIGPNVTLATGTVLWVLAQTNAIVAVRGGYVEPSQWNAPTGETFLATPALEAQPLDVPAGVTLWRYEAQSGRWQAGLTGDLASLSDLPPTLAPGEAIYVHSNQPTDLEVPAAEMRVRYYHQDHLGSSSVMTDADGKLIEETAFYPFGIPRHEHRPRQVEESYKFTQKERDRESGLHYFETRYLAGAMSSFLSVDPMYANSESSADDPQALNLYAYVRNNPLAYTDPTGLDRYSEIANEAAVQDTKAAKDDEPTLLKIGRVSANIVAGAADALPIEPNLIRNAALFKATGLANENSGVYKVSYWTTFVASFAIPIGGGANAARGGGRAALGGGEVANVAKSVVDPLAKTPFVTDAYRTTQAAVAAPKALSKGAITPVSTGGGASAIRSAQVARRAAVAAENAQVKAYLDIVQPIQAANLHLVKSGVHPSTVLNMSFQQAAAVWMSKFGTRPPGL